MDTMNPLKVAISITQFWTVNTEKQYISLLSTTKEGKAVSVPKVMHVDFRTPAAPQEFRIAHIAIFVNHKDMIAYTRFEICPCQQPCNCYCFWYNSRKKPIQAEYDELLLENKGTKV